MRIGQLADAAGTTTRTVRHYHRLGLLEEPRRRSNRYREYDVGDVLRLMRVRWLADSGVPLSAVPNILSDDAVGDGGSNPAVDLRALIDALDGERERLARRQTRLTAMLADVEAGRPLSALPAEVAEALAVAVAAAEAPVVVAALRREWDLLEMLALSGSVPESYLASYAAVVADDERRPRYLSLLADWSALEGREPDSAEADIDALARRLIDWFTDEDVAAALESGEIDTSDAAEMVVSLEEVIPDPSQREVVLRVQRVLAGREERR
ncbi:MerR family transcriptional regulator [Rhodococcus kronopolitis]|uniref:MerR family transcriptional regulator n=1 Tax=Rhodococcus kronopolitis TaxID=1460226 RepID=A0ABV9FQZ7_9NOCA